MSHIVTIRTQVRDAAAVAGACQRLQLPPPEQRTVQLFNATASGLAVQLPGWRYPLVCDTATGQLRYDNYQGQWGDVAQLHRFLQGYAIVKATSEARRQGHSVCERTLADGSVRLTVQVAGGVA